MLGEVEAHLIDIIGIDGFVTHRFFTPFYQVISNATDGEIFEAVFGCNDFPGFEELDVGQISSCVCHASY